MITAETRQHAQLNDDSQVVLGSGVCYAGVSAAASVGLWVDRGIGDGFAKTFGDDEDDN